MTTCGGTGSFAFHDDGAAVVKSPVIVIPDYHGHRIEVAALPVNGERFNAVIRIRRTLSDAQPYVETVTCLKVNAMLAEAAGERWAKRWIDLRS